MKWFLAAAAAACTVAAPGVALAHTEPDLIAVPAGSASTIHLKPTHGCGESPTVVVRVRAPFPDATAGDVEGWTATATPDGAGNTVLEWAGGLLPADEDGAFPVQFTAPDTVGTLLTFPAIQVCENGEELAWIRTRAYGDFWSYMLLAEGAVDIAAEPELELYDMAALDVIVREAGGRFTSLDGTDGPWGGNALATNRHLHEAALSFLGAMADDGDDPDVPRRGPGSVSNLRDRHAPPVPD